MRLLDSVLVDFRTRTVLLCASVGNTCKTSRSSNINIASLLTRHNVLLICNEFCSQLILSHVNASNSPLRSVHTKESSIANRSHDTLQWRKRSWICSGEYRWCCFGFGKYRLVKWVATHIFPQDSLLKCTMQQLVYAFQCTGRDRLPLIFVIWSTVSWTILKFHVKFRYQSWCQLL